MKKLQIKISLLLPEVPDEKDQCVERLIQQPKGKEGLEKFYVTNEKREWYVKDRYAGIEI